MAAPLRAPGASGDHDGPSPIIYNQIPVLDIITGGRNVGWGFYDEFVNQPGSTSTLDGYVLTAYTSGTVVQGGDVGGSIALTPSATEDQGLQIQRGEAFYIDTPYKIAFEARVKVTDVSEADLLVGLAITDTSVLSTTDEIGLKLADGSANILYIVSKDSAGSATDTTADAADATYVRLGCVIDGETSAKFYVNGVLYTTVTSGFPNDEALAPTIAIANGTNSANTTYVDWFYGYQWYKV